MDKDIEKARQLAAAGVPIFLMRPSDEYPKGGSSGLGYIFPPRWQDTKPDPAVLDDYEPGMAVCALMGHVVDAVDQDPRNGPGIEESFMPLTYGTQRTPSGGTHDLIATMGVRSRDGVQPGVDVKAGKNGKGHGFIFIAPTTKQNHDGVEAQYVWESPPHIDERKMQTDTSTRALRELINSKRNNQNTRPSYNGPDFDSLSEEQQAGARQFTEEKIDMWLDQLDSAADEPEGWRDGYDRGWEALTRDAAWAIACLAVNPWSSLPEDDAQMTFEGILPEPIAENPKCKGKWHEGILEKASATPVDQPPWTDFDVLPMETLKNHNLPTDLSDADLSVWIAEMGLRDNWRYCEGVGWLRWDGTRWNPTSDKAGIRAVSGIMTNMHLRATEIPLDTKVIKQFKALKSAGRISAITELMKAMTLIDTKDLDAHPELLNVTNGIVNLRTGKLHPHDKGFFMTKIAGTKYDPDATSKDFDKVLEALDPEVVEWMQIRFGQAATGFATSDDIIPIGQGDGSNGKTTMLDSITSALGEYSVSIPDSLLMSGANEHPAVLMTLFGARLATLEETPEIGTLNIQRVKSLVGTGKIKARALYKDYIEWVPSHSLIITTNHVPRVTETDHGTWRRLSLVKFNKTFKQDDAFRQRLRNGLQGQHEATLAWIIRGSMRWYEDGMRIPGAPDRVVEDTKKWRGESDVLLQYLSERLVPDPNACVLTSEFREDLNIWLRDHGNREWSDSLMSSRLGQHGWLKDNGVFKVKSQSMEGLSRKFGDAAPKRATVWRGVRWLVDADEAEGLPPLMSRQDLLDAYISNNLVFDKDSCVLVADLRTDLNEWLVGQNYGGEWSAGVVGQELAMHPRFKKEVEGKNAWSKPGLVTKHVEDPKKVARIYTGVRFADAKEESLI